MFKNILLPVDDSALSLRPMEAAIKLARLNGAKIVALSVAEPRLLHASDYDEVRPGSDIETVKQERAKNNVKKACTAVMEAGIECESVVATSADPEDEIVKTARHYECDLIVMATRGEMGVIDTIFGESTTQRVLQNSTVPVLVFP